MKISAFLLLVCCIQVSASAVSQNITYSGKDVSLTEIFNVIEKQTGYLVVASKKQIGKARPVTIDAKNLPLHDFMQLVLAEQPFTFIVENNTISIKMRPAVVDLKSTTILFAPPDPIRGVVRDSSGAPLNGATVFNKRTKQSVQTNAEGEFNIDGGEGDVLRLTFIGFETQNITFRGTDMIAVMRVSNSPLDEVQVQAYGTTSIRRATGNITTIKAEEIAKQPVDNPLLALQGRVPGLIITPSSGLPGAPVTLQLRGQNSLTGTLTQPLILIDGIPFTNNMPGANGSLNTLNASALRFVNPNDIASIDILKDADATSIYGSRGANGVILITTKKGRIGAARFNLNVYTGFSQRPRTIKMMNTEQYVTMRKEAYANDGLPLPTTPNSSNYDLTLWGADKYTDWQNVFGGESGTNTSAQASFSGGTSTMQYLISARYAKLSSTFPGRMKDQTGSGHFNISGNGLNKKLRVSLIGGYTINNSKVPDFTRTSLFLAPNAPDIYNGNGELNWEPNPITGFATWTNPMAGLLNVAETQSNTFNVSFEIGYKIFKQFEFRSNFGFSKVQLQSYVPSTIASRDPATISFATGNSSRNNNGTSSFTIDPQLVFTDHVLGGKLDAIVGATWQEQEVYFQWIRGLGYTSDALLRNLAAATSYQALNSKSQYRYNGAFARLTYNFYEKYIFNVSARRDGSSRFGPGNQFGNFGSVGVAWVFSNESFIQKNVQWLSFGKFRFTYGSSGNDAIQDYQYLQLYSTISGSAGIYQDSRTILPERANNSYYHWETTKKLEAALELGFLKDKVILTTAYFRNRSGDQLGSFSTPATSGTESIVMNQPAKIQNTGAELTIVSENIKTKNFRWATSGNISFTRNKLLSLSAGFTFDGFANYYGNEDPVGKPFAGIINVREFLGVDPATGLYQFADYSGQATSDPNNANPYARRITTRPDFTGGLSNSISYKNFSLDVFLQFSKGMGRNYLFDFLFQTPGRTTGNTSNMPIELYNNAWRKPGDVATIQKVSQSADMTNLWNAARNSDAAWVDASFISIKNVSISYGISNEIKRKLKIQDLRMFMQGQNLFLVTKYKGTDPETQSVGSLPQLRIITFGFSVGF